MLRRIIAMTLGAGVLTIGLGAVATPAQAQTCYRVGFDHQPNARAEANPPSVWVDDGDPYVESYPC